MNLKIYK